MWASPQPCLLQLRPLHTQLQVRPGWRFSFHNAAAVQWAFFPRPKVSNVMHCDVKDVHVENSDNGSIRKKGRSRSGKKVRSPQLEQLSDLPVNGSIASGDDDGEGVDLCNMEIGQETDEVGSQEKRKKNAKHKDIDESKEGRSDLLIAFEKFDPTKCENVSKLHSDIKKRKRKRSRVKEKLLISSSVINNNQGEEQNSEVAQFKCVQSSSLRQVPSLDENLSTIRLTLEVEINSNEQLYLCAMLDANSELDAPNLDPEVAIQMTRIQSGLGAASLWQAEIKAPFGLRVAYNYFIKVEERGLSTVSWRPGPIPQFCVPPKGQPGLDVIKDTWVKNHDGSEDEFTPNHSSLPPRQDNEHQLGEIQEDPFYAVGLLIQMLQANVKATEIGNKTHNTLDKVEEVLKVPETGSDIKPASQGKVIVRWPEFSNFPRRKVFPREEPWLLESIILSVRVSEPETAAAEPEVAVDIYINSSECTMQRIAIVEDKKLVQLLLEPINSSIQVGNVYLGVVKQLLPGMNGVFVDIGSPRTALLAMNMHHYPFAFSSHKQSSPITSNASSDVSAEDDSVEDEDQDVEFYEDLNQELEEDSEESNLQDDEEVFEQEDNGYHEHTDNKPVREPITNTNTSDSPFYRERTRKWKRIKPGMLMMVQVKKEALRKKGPQVTASIGLAGRFWVLMPRVPTLGVSQRISGFERTRIKNIARELQPDGFGLTARTEALGRPREELEKDLARLLDSWKEIVERAEAASRAVASGVEGAAPILLHRAMCQTLRTVRDIFNEHVQKLVVDSSQTYQQVTRYLQEVAPHLCDRVELYTGKIPIFDAFNLEQEIDKFSTKRVDLPNGAYLVVEETEALVSIDVNGGLGMLGESTSQKNAVLEVNLAAARQIAIEMRLRDIGGIIVVDFIDMESEEDESLVYEEMRKAVQRDRSRCSISEISEYGLMEIIRKRVRPSVTLTMSESCSCCHGTGRVESLESTLSKIERAIRRLLASKDDRGRNNEDKKWPQVLLRVDPIVYDYLRSRGRRRVNQLSAALKVFITLKVAVDFGRGQFLVTEQPLAPLLVGRFHRRNGISPKILVKRARPPRA